MESYKARRLENIMRNAALVQELGLQSVDLEVEEEQPKQPPAKRRKFTAGPPTRSSARLANAPTRPSYYVKGPEKNRSRARSPRSSRQQAASPEAAEHGADQAPEAKDVNPSPDQDGIHTNQAPETKDVNPSTDQDATHTSQAPEAKDVSPSTTDLNTIRAGWTSWKPVAPEPTRDASGTYHFASHPEFTPNMSPEAMIREGSFGGGYWRPLYSRRLQTTISDDWRELPAAWTKGVDVGKYLTNPRYDTKANRYGAPCCEITEDWELVGRIEDEFNIRGWFQWYCRFWMGRRCATDELQISRWKDCVGKRGPWRRFLLKRYVRMGVRSVLDPRSDELEVNSILHQQCQHWAYTVTQEALDRFWAEGK